MTVFGFVNTYTRFCVAGEGKSAAAWPSLMTLIREGLMSTYACLPLISILDNYIHRSTQLLEDKRAKRDLHDLTQKLVDACVAIAVKTSAEGVSGILEDDDDDQSGKSTLVLIFVG
jgi:hypothetical protein